MTSNGDGIHGRCATRGCARRAEVMAFPPARRLDFVRRQAAWFVEQSHEAAEANLARQLERQRETLLRKGVNPDRLTADIRQLEDAIRREVWRLVLTPEVGA